MKSFTFFALCLLIIISCNKQSSQPAGSSNGNTAVAATNDTAKEGSYPSKIRVFVNDVAIPVTSIHYNRSTGSFNFSAGNSLKKVDAKCFWFYQQSRWSYQYSDSITYATRPDTLTTWTTTTATNRGNVTFDCCNAPLTDSLVEGEYTGSFVSNKNNIIVKGDFHLVF